MAVINRELSKEIETVFLMTSKRNSFISSNIVRQIASVQGDVSSMVPQAVHLALQKKFTR
jgi:pantetheine-phosphate adenylyltransferase